jgi:hypothetical protein
MGGPSWAHPLLLRPKENSVFVLRKRWPFTERDGRIALGRGQMNWKRGFWRLWLVGTSLWLALEFWSHRALLTSLLISGQDLRFTVSSLRSAFQSADQYLIEHVLHKTCPPRPQGRNLLGPECDINSALFRRHLAFELSTRIFIPPAAALLFGFCFYWVTSGFRARQS